MTVHKDKKSQFKEEAAMESKYFRFFEISEVCFIEPTHHNFGNHLLLIDAQLDKKYPLCPLLTV